MHFSLRNQFRLIEGLHPTPGVQKKKNRETAEYQEAKGESYLPT
jgi:hypothetical protein